MTVSDPQPSAPAEGLRARRRRQTRAELHAATVRLAREHGFAQVTVEMISKEVGVSPRTFFNYFPSKEAALFALFGTVPPALADRFAEGEGSGTDAVLRDLGDILADHLQEAAPEPQELEDSLRIAEGVPSVLATFLAQCEAVERDLAGLIARRTGTPPDGEAAELLAGVAMATVRSGIKRWHQSGAHADEGEGPAERVRESFDSLRTLLGPAAVQ
ncbi:TetR/AcrR family transcriptional regulator [Streptomyces endophyticus]|uniref:TetR/AcrR family transcriptional regulator n=1 Tax=Streptomyces endophyticus TaxID=714166 RepID=A0ABU6FDU6_9ACTN|nr:TetR family transcriptional regulator [Streptomyces endophyticus]MEB8342221.1 TetR/AcrR family transcriptional regulator [Streptomyces endophyticus]